MMASAETLPAVLERLEKVLSYSVADETELLWIETRRGEVSSGRRREAVAKEGTTLTRRAVTVRVKEGPRLGRYTTEDGDAAELASALRVALAHAHVTHAEAGPWQPPPLEKLTPLSSCFDPRIAALEGAAAVAENERGLAKGETSVLTWSTLRVAFLSSRGLRHSTELTGAALAIESGKGPGASLASHAARTLAALDQPCLLEAARSWRADGEVEESWQPAADGSRPPLLLSPEVVAKLAALLNSVAFTAEGFSSGGVLGPADLGGARFSPLLSLWDDGSDPTGLAFPFDFEGRIRRRVTLIERGILRSAALDSRLAAEVGLEVTPHYLGPNEVRAQHLFVEPGDASMAQLLGAADGGLWIGRLSSLSPQAPGSSHFQATAEGCRLIRDGRLAEALPPLRWDDDLLRVFGALVTVGAEAWTRALDSDLRGSVRAPALVTAGGGLLSR